MPLLLFAPPLLAALAASAGAQAGPRDWPPATRAFLSSYCLDCHDSETRKGGVDLETLRLDWDRPSTAATLERMHRMLSAGDMPPAHVPQPAAAERDAQVAWLDGQLAEHQSLGGALLRRLNGVEYVASVHALFPLRERLPVALPPDAPAHGFDTLGEALVVSPTHMRQYLEAATWVADQLIPPESRETVALELAALDFAGSKTHYLEDRQRLVNSIDVIARSAGRAERFIAPRDGVYRFRLSAAALPAASEPAPRLEVRAWQHGRSTLEPVTGARLLLSVELGSTAPAELDFEGELFAGETLLFYFANAALTARDRFLERPVAQRFRQRAPALFNALVALGYDRTLVPEENWARLVEYVLAGGPPADEERRQAFRRDVEQGLLTNEFVTVFGFHAAEHGPAIDLFGLKVEGPLRALETLTRYLPPRAGADGRELEPRAFAQALLGPLLRRAFRRPLEPAELERYLDLTLAHAAETGSLESGLHLALRAILCSPSFLYRETRPGALDDFDLVARLSYFLWSGPPTDELLDLAEAPGALADEDLEALVRRMLASPHARRFAEHFTGQWLSTRQLAGIMPDERLFPVWEPGMYRALTQETEAFFMHVLLENLPVATFLDADFAFLNEQNARIYGLPGVEGLAMRRVALPAGSPRGGVLGMASVLMATANGVDTSPVLRGVWLLENLLGDPPPPPPDDVPALTPDAGGASTVRAALAVHRADPSCARCHDDIDPLGFALEQLDPIGAWREHYPVLAQDGRGGTSIRPGPAVDASGELPDGTRLSGLADLKRHLLLQRQVFTRCLTEKLLVYSTGRALNSADRRAAAELVRALDEQDGGFLDLVVALVQSPVFRTK